MPPSTSPGVWCCFDSRFVVDNKDRSLDRRKLGFFFPPVLIDDRDVLVRQLLQLLLRIALLIFRGLLVVDHAPYLLDAVAAYVSHRNPPVLDARMHHLNQLFPPLLRQWRHGHADYLAIVVGCEAKVGLLQRFLDRS